MIINHKPTTVLILTHRDNITNELVVPHLEWLEFYNPDVRVEIISDVDDSISRDEAWRNGDRKLRNWWKVHGQSIDSDTIAIFEWDTLMKGELPSLPYGLDLAGKWVYKMGQHWNWWSEASRMECDPIGLVSFGAFFMKRWVLDAISQDKWNETFDKDIINELRFPSVAKAEGAIIGIMDLPFVDWKEVKLGDEMGLYHGIKQSHQIPNKKEEKDPKELDQDQQIVLRSANANNQANGTN